MRMEELSDSRYIKSTDQVERYLLGLVEEYCKNSNVSSPSILLNVYAPSSISLAVQLIVVLHYMKRLYLFHPL